MQIADDLYYLFRRHAGEGGPYFLPYLLEPRLGVNFDRRERGSEWITFAG